MRSWWWFTLLVVALHPWRASAAPPAQACVPPDTARTLVECKARKQAKPHGGTSPPALALPASARVRVPDAGKPRSYAPGLDLPKEARTALKRLEQRKLSLLEREIALVERLRRNDARQAEVLLRLGQLYFELAEVREQALRALDQPLFEACRGKRRDAGRCRGLEREQAARSTALDQARAGSVRALAALIAGHPSFARVDEALFALGFVLEQTGQTDKARVIYRQLIREHPESAHVPYAYLAFAEHYFREGDMNAARQFYAKVVEIPAERNPVHGYALYKQAWCLVNLDDFTGALRLLIETIELARARPEDRQLAPILAQARREIIIPYARVGSPEKALAFFERYEASRAQALETYERLGELYFDTGQWKPARAVYHGLMAAQPDSPRLCAWQRRVADTALASNDKPGQVREALRLLDVYQTSPPKPPEAGACRESAATLLITLAVAWHREAVGTDTQPGTLDRNTMAQAEQLYAQTLAAFPDLDAIAFSDFDARDKPTRYRLAYYRAELAFQLERFEACGAAFDEVLAIDPRGELTEDAAFGAVLCYDRVHQSRYQTLSGKALAEETEKERLAPRELDATERAMLAAFERYLCYAPDGPEALRIQYRRARVYYEANRFPEAAVLFARVAFDPRGDELSPIAANLYLDSLNVIGMREPALAAACQASMGDALEPLAKLHCGEGKEHALCTVVSQLRCDLLRKQAERQHAAQQYRAAAETYVSIARAHRECGKLDEVLYDAALDYEAARLVGRAIRVRKALVDQFPQSPWAARSRFLLGANFHALAFYEQAAGYYEDFARRHPTQLGQDCRAEERQAGACPSAIDALSNAIFFRLGLGEEAEAAKDAELFERSFGKRDPAGAARVRFALGSLYERAGDPARIARHYREFLRDYGRRAAPHERIAAELRIGRAERALGHGREAQEAFERAVSGFAALPAAAAEKPSADGDAERSVALARVAAAEAAYERAELLRAEFDAVPFPKLRVRGSDRALRAASFARWREQDFTRWIASKSGALDAARKAYEAVDGYQVPQSSIAAAARVGDMYLAFVDAFREAPLPPELEHDEELATIYRQALDEASAPWVKQAEGAFRFCLETATRVRWFGESLTHCESELSALDPRTYPRAAELRLPQPFEVSELSESVEAGR